MNLMKKNLLSLFRKFLKLHFKDKVLLIKVALKLILIKFLLESLPFEKFKKVFKYFSTSNNIKDVNKITYFAKASSSFLNITCLPQALCVKSFYSGVDSIKLTLGVNNSNQKLNAHAWVTHDKKIIIGDLPFESFKPIWVWE